MSFIKHIFKRHSGFSLTELTVAMAIMGGLSLGVMQLLKNANKQSSTFSSKQDLKSIMRSISQDLVKSDVCSDNFQGKPIESSLNEVLKKNSTTGDVYPLIRREDRVVNNKYKVSSITTRPIIQDNIKNKTAFELVIEFTSVNGNEQNRKEVITVAADIEGDTIAGCHSPDDSLIDAVLTDIQKVCKGQGIEQSEEDGTCSIKNFVTYPAPESENPYAGPGKAFTKFGFTSPLYTTLSTPPLNTANANCPNSAIQHFNLDGTVTCLDLAARVVQAPVTISSNQTCGIKVNLNKELVFSCSSAGSNGPPPGGNCTPNCPTKEQVCPPPGIWNGPDGCGGLCHVKGISNDPNCLQPVTVDPSCPVLNCGPCDVMRKCNGEACFSCFDTTNSNNIYNQPNCIVSGSPSLSCGMNNEL